MSKQWTTEQEDFLTTTLAKAQGKFSAAVKRNGTIIPYIPFNGHYPDMAQENIHWWTNGFWAGILWQMYHLTQEEQYLVAARYQESLLDGALNEYEKLDHDVGFMWLSAAVADYTLTQNPNAKTRGLKALQALASRYNPTGQFLLAWNGPEQQGQMIIDCLMNLPLLYWGTQETGDPRYGAIATNHAHTALRYLLRSDGSVNHIVVLNPATGAFEKSLGGQGYGVGSSWSRGQSWAIYGMALAYENTQDPAFLAAAKNVAHYFIANVALTDFVSVIDFRAPQEPVRYDTTATAIAACGLLSLAQHVPPVEKNFYQTAALKMVQALTAKFCDFEPATDGLLTHGSAKYHGDVDQEVPIIYGDYFYLEALLRLLGKDLKIYEKG